MAAGRSQGRYALAFAEIEILQFGNQAGENRVHGRGCRGGSGLPTLSCSVQPEPGANLQYRLINRVNTPGIAVLVVGLPAPVVATVANFQFPLPPNPGLVG